MNYDDGSDNVEPDKRPVCCYRFGRQWVESTYMSDMKAWWQSPPCHWSGLSARARGWYRQSKRVRKPKKA